MPVAPTAFRSHNPIAGRRFARLLPDGLVVKAREAWASRWRLRRPKPPAPESNPDAQELERFYATPQGREIARQIGRMMRRIGGEHGRGTIVAGFGYTAPYLGLWPQARRIDASAPGTDPERIDPADLVILVHALDCTDNPRALLREAWKLLADHGRLIVVVPNRMGPLAHLPNTPFARGRAWGISELDRLLAENLFRTEIRRLAVSLPGPRTRLSAIGDPLFGGMIVAVAVKDVYAGVPLQRAARRRVAQLA